MGSKQTTAAADDATLALMLVVRGAGLRKRKRAVSIEEGRGVVERKQAEEDLSDSRSQSLLTGYGGRG